MRLTEAFAELDQIYTPAKKDLTEGRSMPYALLVLLDGEWKVYKGLDFELTDNELADFLEDKPEYSAAKVIPATDIQKYVNKKPVLQEDRWLSREELIAELEKLGYKYKFDKYSDRQLYSILEKTKAKIESDKALAELEHNKTDVKPICDDCGSVLADSGICPKCYDGATDLDEGVFDNKPYNMLNWKASSSTQPSSTVSNNNLPKTVNSSKKIVTIFYDPKARKLRAQADDGVNGIANVAFPNNLRTAAGQQYEVDQLVWNGKNYRVSGNIKPVNSVSNTQNINENINKENYEMNFQTILEELDKLYEEMPAAEQLEEASAGIHLDGKNLDTIEEIACEIAKQDCDMSYVKKWVNEVNSDISVEDLVIAAEQSEFARQIKELSAYMRAKGYKTFGDFAKALTEALTEESEEELIDDETIADDADVEEAPVEEVAEEEPKQIVLECSKCGALVIKTEADVVVDEASDLVNIEDACQYCEEAAGYTIVGTIAPYEAINTEEAAEAEIVEEGLFGKEVEKTIKASEVKKGDKIVAFDGDKLSRPSKVTKVEVEADIVNIAHKDGTVGGGCDTPVTVLTKE